MIKSYYLCAVRDDQYNYFERPFAIDDLNAAKRGFSDALFDSDHPYSKNPRNYSLHHLHTLVIEDGVLLDEPMCERVPSVLFTAEDFDVLFQHHLESMSQGDLKL